MVGQGDLVGGPIVQTPEIIVCFFRLKVYLLGPFEPESVYKGIYGDYGKEHGNYCLRFRVCAQSVPKTRFAFDFPFDSPSIPISPLNPKKLQLLRRSYEPGSKLLLLYSGMEGWSMSRDMLKLLQHDTGHPKKRYSKTIPPRPAKRYGAP